MRGTAREFGVPNWLTLSRLLLTAPIAWAIRSQELHIAFILFLTAALTDGLDGRIARRTGRAGGFGAVFDLFTDGVLFLAVILPLWWNGMFWQFWAIALIVSAIIPILSQAGLMRRERRLIIHGDKVGKICGVATYFSLALAILGKGTELIFPFTIPLIYLSVIRDAYRMRRGLANEVSIKKVQGVDAENDVLLWGLKQLDLSPYAFVAWVFAVTALGKL